MCGIVTQPYDGGKAALPALPNDGTSVPPFADSFTSRLVPLSGDDLVMTMSRPPRRTGRCTCSWFPCATSGYTPTPPSANVGSSAPDGQGVVPSEPLSTVSTAASLST